MAAPGRALHGVGTAIVSVPDGPFGVATSQGGAWSFVSTSRGVTVLSDRGFLPAVARTVDVTGAALTHDGRYLLTPAQSGGEAVLSVDALERGSSSPLLGALQSGRGQADGGGGIEVVTSRDDRFAFVSLEGAGELAVYDLQLATTMEAFARPASLGTCRWTSRRSGRRSR